MRSCKSVWQYQVSEPADVAYSRSLKFSRPSLPKARSRVIQKDRQRHVQLIAFEFKMAYKLYRGKWHRDLFARPTGVLPLGLMGASPSSMSLGIFQIFLPIVALMPVGVSGSCLATFL